MGPGETCKSVKHNEKFARIRENGAPSHFTLIIKLNPFEGFSTFFQHPLAGNICPGRHINSLQ